MPKQNRVTPVGDLVAVPDRGTMTGNRGIIHDAGQRIVRPWQVRRWLVCELEYRGRHREVMAPGRYTELFFLDEATALAAGHRPCFECRRAKYHEFCSAWQRAHPAGGRAAPTADEMDRRLHAERVGPGRTKRVYEADAAGLPDGVFVRRPGPEGTVSLIWRGDWLTWTASGYRARSAKPRRGRVEVLTPPSTVAAIRAGYAPGVHPSAG